MCRSVCFLLGSTSCSFRPLPGFFVFPSTHHGGRRPESVGPDCPDVVRSGRPASPKNMKPLWLLAQSSLGTPVPRQQYLRASVLFLYASYLINFTEFVLRTAFKYHKKGNGSNKSVNHSSARCIRIILESVTLFCVPVVVLQWVQNKHKWLMNNKKIYQSYDLLMWAMENGFYDLKYKLRRMQVVSSTGTSKLLSLPSTLGW